MQKNFKKDIKEWINKYKFTENNDLEEMKEKKDLIIKKLANINETPFAFVYKRFCEKYSLDVNDLWPVVDDGNISLYKIRNKLIHGTTLDQSTIFSLYSAERHLLWTVERMILAILGWPIKRSRVSKGFLKNMSFYNEKRWKNDREKLSI